MISCPANIVVNVGAGQCAAEVSFAVSATDNCGSVANLVSVPASGSAFPVGVTTVRSTGTDVQGNTAQCSFTVTVREAQTPMISCPANIVVNAAPGQCASNATFTVTESTDSCGSVTNLSFLHLGFNLDEEYRPVFDGMNPVIAGTRNGLNVRFSVPTPGQPFRLGHLRPGWESPFTWMPEIDAVAGRFGWMLERSMKDLLRVDHGPALAIRCFPCLIVYWAVVAIPSDASVCEFQSCD